MADIGTASVTLKAAESGNPDAQCELAMMYEHGIGVQKDYQQAIRWYSAAADGGSSMAPYKLALLYESDFIGAPDLKTAVKWLERGAQAGLPEAQYKLGLYFENGKGIEPNCEHAAKWYKLAAGQNVTDAYFRLGQLYEQGLGVKKDNAAAVEYYKVAAKAGNPNAQYHLGVLYVEGDGIEQNIGEALLMFERAAEAGHKQARKRLSGGKTTGTGATGEATKPGADKGKGGADGEAPKKEETVAEFIASTLKQTVALMLVFMVCCFTPLGDLLLWLWKSTGWLMAVIMIPIVIVAGLSFLKFFTGRKKEVNWFQIGCYAAVGAVILIIFGVILTVKFEFQDPNAASTPKIEHKTKRIQTGADKSAEE